ncbi:MAG: hypothetical protein GEU79_18210 [Acidimicrobiia bacterium]|nr:hypothetical protein [Acidimicrobiia bacterium]
MTTKWPEVRLRWVVGRPFEYGLNTEASNYVDHGIRFLRTTDFEDDGEIRKGDERFLSPELVPTAYRLSEGDLLVSRSGTVGRSASVPQTVLPATFAGYLIRIPRTHQLAPRFICWWTSSRAFSAGVAAGQVESTIANFNAARYASLRIPLPPLEAQERIAEFLDTETAKIDTLIEKDRHLIDLLDEKRSALISHTVTKGLDPTATTTPTNIPWLGEIPQHWDVVRLGGPFEVRVGRQRSPQHAEGPFMTRYLRATNVTPAVLDLSDVKMMNFDPREREVFRLRHGDLLVTEGAGSLEAVGATAQWHSELEGIVCFQNTLILVRPRTTDQVEQFSFWPDFDTRIAKCLVRGSRRNSFVTTTPFSG